MDNRCACGSAQLRVTHIGTFSGPIPECGPLLLSGVLREQAKPGATSPSRQHLLGIGGLAYPEMLIEVDVTAIVERM
jgi:hypothetical protein